MEHGGLRITVFLLLGVAGVTGLSALVGSNTPSEATASNRLLVEEPDTIEPADHGGSFGASDDRRPIPAVVAGGQPALRTRDSRLDAYLSRRHDLILPPPSAESQTWRWEDDSTQIAFEGCKPKARDPLVPKAKLHVAASIDFTALEAIETHFGFLPSEVLSLESGMLDEPESASFADRVGPEVVAALGKHGILVEKSVVRADFAWLVRQTAPQLRGLALAVTDEWRRAVRESPDDGEQRPGNAPRVRADIEALTSFVQRAVRYADVSPNTDGHERCGVRTPGPTLMRGGDCDSKALLLASLIRSIDTRVPLVLISLSVGGRPHMMIGVGVEAHACSSILDYGGQRYVLIEVTSALGVGIMAPDYNDAVLEHYAVIP